MVTDIFNTLAENDILSHRIFHSIKHKTKHKQLIEIKSLTTCCVSRNMNIIQLGLVLRMFVFRTIHFYDPCPAGRSTPDL